MTLAMDGVRTTRRSDSGIRRPEPAQTAVKPVQATGYVTGMDGVRRPIYRPQPVRQPLPQIKAVTVPRSTRRMAGLASGAVVAQPTPAVSTPEYVSQPRSWRPIRWPHLSWKRPAIAFGLVATAIVASTVAVRVIAPPQATTARAASERPAITATPVVTAAAVATAAPTTPKAVALQQLVDTFAAANPGKFGIVVKDLTTGETASIDPDRQVTSASLYKLFVAQRIYQQVDLKQLDYNKAAGSGTGRSVNQCLTVMINISDNDCGRALGTILGWGSQDHALTIEGYKETTLTTPQKTSAGDVAVLFERLYRGTLVSADSSARFLDLLKDQRVNNRLPQGLPTGTVIAHKTGDLDGVVHDAGIVYGPKTNYEVVVVSGPWNSPGNAPAMFADLSKQLWNYFEN